MNVYENVFFREATLRICSSLDLVTALKRCFEYLRRALSLQKNGAGFDCRRSLYHRINIAPQNSSSCNFYKNLSIKAVS